MDGRSAQKQLTTAQVILALGKQQLAEHEATGAHADRIDGIRDLIKKWGARVSQLEPLAANEKLREAGQGSAFGL